MCGAVYYCTSSQWWSIYSDCDLQPPPRRKPASGRSTRLHCWSLFPVRSVIWVSPCSEQGSSTTNATTIYLHTSVWSCAAVGLMFLAGIRCYGISFHWTSPVLPHSFISGHTTNIQSSSQMRSRKSTDDIRKKLEFNLKFNLKSRH